jgi:hypothetical protein
MTLEYGQNYMGRKVLTFLAKFGMDLLHRLKAATLEL